MIADSLQETHNEIAQLYSSGLYLQAFKKSESLGPLTEWNDPSARVLGGRMATNLGADRLGRVLHRLAYRDAPEDPEVTLFYALSASGRKGLLAALQWMDGIRHMDSAPDTLRADWLAHRSRLLAGLRDFKAAEEGIDRALTLAPDRAWLWVERSGIYEQEDCEDDALKAARKAIDLQPWYRPAVQNLAYRLVQMNQDQEAMELLSAAAEKLESGSVLLQLAALHHELKQYDEARAIYDSVDQYFPLIEYDKEFPKWLAARRADAAYYTGDIPRAIEQAKLSESKFHERVATRLEDKTLEAKRVHLPVKFVRQHHLTCAPATLSALSAYWSKPAPHLDVVEKICYDGTPAHSERRWATENGFYVREFRVTWESTVLLIDNEIPFTLTTVDPGNAHLQSVVGYDNQRGTMTIQDPGERHASEGAGAELVKHYASSGPRGMAFVPESQQEKLESLNLPESDLYDDYFQLELALEAHKRDEAAGWLEKMKEKAADHRLTLKAHGNLANYDADYRGLLESTEALLEQFPEDVNLQLTKMACLQDLNLREERIAWLREQNAKADCNPLFQLRYAVELSEDAREEENVKHLLSKVTRYRPHDGQALHLLASQLWDQHQRDEALQIYRYAACVDGINENLSRTYFQAARNLSRTDEALEFLKDRFARAGDQSTLPARTLSWAYENLEMMKESFDVLESSMQQHPEDGSMMLYAASAYSRYGEGKRAEELIGRAESINRRTDWLRAKATVALNSGELKQGLGYWREVAEADPLDSNAQDMVASLTAELEDNSSAAAYLQTVVDRFPHSLALNSMLIEWLRDDKSKCEAAVRLFLEKHPHNPWGHRELALSMYAQKQYDEALQSLAMAEQVEPDHHFVHYLRGRISETHLGDIDTAKENYRKTIELSVDFEPAMVSLIESCDSKDERRVELNFIQKQLEEQVTFGEGLLAYRNLARSTFTPDQMLTVLQATQKKRPDLWHAWSALIYQLTEMERLDEALEWAEKSTQRFGLLSRVWIDLAHVHRIRKEQDGEILALQRAWDLNPAWSEPARSLADAYEAQGDTEKAEKTLLRAIALEPKESRNYGCLGNLLWNLGRQEEAISELERAVNLNPRYQWAWDALREYCDVSEQPDRFLSIAREVTQKRPEEASSWLLLGELLIRPEQSEEAIAATRKAIELKPRDAEAYSQLAYFLSREGDFEEALKACRPQPFGEQPPLELRSREAWIHAVSGNLDKGISLMKEVLDQDPEYFWAWNQLVEWTDGHPDYKEVYQEAATNMVRIAPQHAPGWGYLADIELQKENTAEAKKHLQRAIEITPEYLYGSKTLIDLHLADKELDLAQETLEMVRTSTPPEWALSIETRIAAAQGRKQDAFESLIKLAKTPAETFQPIDDCGRAMWEQDWGEDAEKSLRGILDEPNTSPGTGFVWVNLCSTLGKWENCWTKLNSLPKSDVWRAAAAKLIDEALENPDGLNVMNKLIRAHKHALKDWDDTWFNVGLAYNNLGEYGKAAVWLSDWRSRPGAEDWAVVLAVMANWALKKPDVATQHAMDAIELRPHSQSNDTLMIWVAANELAYGDVYQAREILQSLGKPATNPLFSGCHEVFLKVSQILLGPAPFGAAKRQIDEVLKNAGDAAEDQIVQRICKQCKQQLASLRGKPIQRLLLKLAGLFDQS